MQSELRDFFHIVNRVSVYYSFSTTLLSHTKQCSFTYKIVFFHILNIKASKLGSCPTSIAKALYFFHVVILVAAPYPSKLGSCPTSISKALYVFHVVIWVPAPHPSKLGSCPNPSQKSRYTSFR